MSLSRLDHVGVSDIDGTLMFPQPEPWEIEAADQIRAFFRKRGTFAVATAQTAEMLFSKSAYDRSVAEGFFSRPPPLLGTDRDGLRTYVPPETIPARVAFTDPDLAISMGTGIYPRRPDGTYRSQTGTEARLGRSFRRGALRLIQTLTDAGEDLVSCLAPIEFKENYELRRTDVFPTPYRVQLEFKDPTRSREENERRKNHAKWRIQSFVREIEHILNIKMLTASLRKETLQWYRDIVGNLIVVDESRPSENKFQIYLMPRLASKESMIDSALTRYAGGKRIKTLDLFGDMPPDLRAGCFAGRAERATFVLVGGSPLTPYFDRESDRYRKQYAGEDMSWMIDHLEPTDRPGVEIFRAPGRRPRRIIFGGIAYPGTRGPLTIKAYLEEEYGPLPSVY